MPQDSMGLEIPSQPTSTACIFSSSKHCGHWPPTNFSRSHVAELDLILPREVSFDKDDPKKRCADKVVISVQPIFLKVTGTTPTLVVGNGILTDVFLKHFNSYRWLWLKYVRLWPPGLFCKKMGKEMPTYDSLLRTCTNTLQLQMQL